jgi:hypothetical protein
MPVAAGKAVCLHSVYGDLTFRKMCPSITILKLIALPESPEGLGYRVEILEYSSNK